MTNVLSACQVSSGNNIRGCRGKKNNQHSKTNVLSACQVSLGNDIRGSRGKKIIYFGVLIVFFAGAPTNVIP